MKYSKEYLENVDVDRLAADLGNNVYAASTLLEGLEAAGRIGCSGHYLRQELSRYAGELLRKNIVS